jgi:DNA-binding winged helix-turn-helix (wHTH) protein
MKLSFEDCNLDLSARQLWRNGKVVPLEPKMYELLNVLIKRRPSVVTNNELDEILWPEVYVARTSLTRLVSELRTVLGDTPHDSRIIRTAYKTGYAFCADVQSSVLPTSGAALISLQWKDRSIPLSNGEHIAGRGAECSVIIDASTVSRRHALISVTSGTATIEDLSSTNGTFVNETRISQPTSVANGNRIALGDEVLMVRANSPSAPTVVKVDRVLKRPPDGHR